MSGHVCPCGCGAQVATEKLACRPGWYRLPRPLRDALSRAYRDHGAGSAQHQGALAAALDWYVRNPGPAAVGGATEEATDGRA